MKLVCIGDSLTTGYGVFKEDSWINILEKSLNMEIINKGVNGDTTAGMLSRSLRDIIHQYPDFVFIMGGCNDIMCNDILEMIENNILELIEESIKYNITPIVGIEPPIIGELACIHWSSDSNYRKISSDQKKYRKWLVKYCIEKKLEYIDFFELFSIKLKNTQPNKLSIDGIHPSKLGHKMMANFALSKIHRITNL